MAKYTPDDIRQLYEAIAIANRILPNFDEVDFETKYMAIELAYRQASGIDETQSPDAGKTIDDLRTEIWTIIETLRVYDQAGFFEGKPTAGQVIYRYVSCRRVNFPENFVGSVAKCIVAPTGSYVITVLRDDLEVGTITFSANVKTGAFASIGAFTLAEGDTLTFKAPVTADSTFETLLFNLKVMWSE
jgi:hypothetical protein